MKTDTPPTDITREKKLALIYRYTNRDYKSTTNGFKAILVFRNGTALVPLESLTDGEIDAKLPFAIKKEAEKLNKPAYYAANEDAMRNGSAIRPTGRTTKDRFAIYMNGDFMGFTDDDTFIAGLTPFTKKEAKALLPAGMGGNVGF